MVVASRTDYRTQTESNQESHQTSLMNRRSESRRRGWRLVDNNEYKRRQPPPGVRVTGKAFGKDRRLPITNAYRG